MIVYCQFGYCKQAKEGQLVSTYHNSNLLEMTNGDYITSLSERRYKVWYLKPVECSDGDIIEVKSKVGLKFLGQDEDRSFIAIFSVNETNEETSFSIPKVGYGKDFPLLKGKIKQLSLLTEREKRLQKLKANLENEDK